MGAGTRVSGGAGEGAGGRAGSSARGSCSPGLADKTLAVLQKNRDILGSLN